MPSLISGFTAAMNPFLSSFVDAVLLLSDLRFHSEQRLFLAGGAD
jgi:hypothetical protein